VVVQVTIDALFEIGDAVEDSASDGVFGDEAEEAFDLVEPRGRGWREMQMKALVARQPCLDLGMFMGRVIVADEMQIERLGRVAVDCAQEA